MREHLYHEFGPLFDGGSRVLVLGSFPSVKSREAAFYYGHPQNRFWRIVRCLEDPELGNSKLIALPDIRNTEGVEDFFRNNEGADTVLREFEKGHGRGDPADYEDFLKVRIALALRNHLALWDTIESCTIEGSSDSSIRDVVPNDIAGLLIRAPIRLICCNGATSYQLFMKYVMPGLKSSGMDMGDNGRRSGNRDGSMEKHLPEPDSLPAVIRLPSTSPANAAWTIPRLWEKWKVVREYIL